MKAAWPPFTEGARNAMVLAQLLATRTGSSVVDTQHLICGVLEVDESPLLALFEARGLSIDAFRERVLREPVDVRHGPDIVFTDASKRLIEGAFDEARLARVNEVGTECLVAAVWQQPESAAARYLSDLGFDGAEVCALMRQQLGLRAAPRVETELGARRSYLRFELTEAEVAPDPLEQLARWINEAKSAGMLEPNAMCVATASSAGEPTARVVLLRGLDERGLIFYTSFSSRKGRQIERNANVAALFYWDKLERQARIEGRAEQIPDDEADAYFASRPRGHQLSAWASEQSEPLESRELLAQRMNDYESRFEGEAVPRPHSWGGYLIRPQRVEFWQGRENRLHDRLEFFKEGGAWRMRRLSP